MKLISPPAGREEECEVPMDHAYPVCAEKVEVRKWKCMCERELNDPALKGLALLKFLS